MGRENSLKNLERGKKFGEGQNMAGNGRKRNYFNEVWSMIVKTDDEEKEVQLSKSDKYRLIERFLELPLGDLKSIARNQSLPVFLVNIASAIAKDIEEGRTVTIDKYFDRFYGRAEQTHTVKAEDTKIPEWLLGKPKQ